MSEYRNIILKNGVTATIEFINKKYNNIESENLDELYSHCKIQIEQLEYNTNEEKKDLEKIKERIKIRNELITHWKLLESRILEIKHT